MFAEILGLTGEAITELEYDKKKHPFVSRMTTKLALDAQIISFMQSDARKDETFVNVVEDTTEPPSLFTDNHFPGSAFNKSGLKPKEDKSSSKPCSDLNLKGKRKIDRKSQVKPKINREEAAVSQLLIQKQEMSYDYDNAVQSASHIRSPKSSLTKTPRLKKAASIQRSSSR